MTRHRPAQAHNSKTVTTKQERQNGTNGTHGTAMNGDQWDNDDSDDDDDEEGWPVEDDDDKGPMGRHGGQATGVVATTTRGAAAPLVFFSFIFSFLFLLFY
jgi:hypothetical protein